MPRFLRDLPMVSATVASDRPLRSICSVYLPSFDSTNHENHPLVWDCTSKRPPTLGRQTGWQPIGVEPSHQTQQCHHPQMENIFKVQQVGGFLWYGTSSADGVGVAVSCRFHHIIVPIGCPWSRADAETTVLHRHIVDRNHYTNKGLWAIITECYS